MSQQQTNQVQESIVRIDLLTFSGKPHTVDTVEGLAGGCTDCLRSDLPWILSRIGVAKGELW